MNMEVKFSALKGYLDCEISSLNSKVDLFIESLKEQHGNSSGKYSFFTEESLGKERYNKIPDKNSDS